MVRLNSGISGKKGLGRGTLEVCGVPERSLLKTLLQFVALHLSVKPTLATWLLLFSKYRVCILANRSGPPAIASRKASACTQETTTTTTQKAKQKSVRQNLASQLCQIGPENYHLLLYLIGWRQGRAMICYSRFRSGDPCLGTWPCHRVDFLDNGY